MGAYDDPLGSILISTWVSSLLLTLIIRETIRYYKTFHTDALSVKIFVGIAIFVDSVSLVADYADVYLYTIKHWGDSMYLKNQYWPVGLYLATTGITGFLVQSFLVHRYYTLTRNWLISLGLAVCIIVSLGGSFATAILLTIFNAYSERFKAKIPVTIWMVTTSVTDILIALVLIWQLYNMKTSFKPTENLIQRLMRAAMQTGSTTSVVAVLTLITFSINHESNIETAFAFILGRVYILTLLYNLNIRKVAKKSAATTTKDRDQRSQHRPGNMTLDGIHVQRTVVQVETVDEPPAYKSEEIEMDQHSIQTAQTVEKTEETV